MEKIYISQYNVGDKLYILNRRNISEGFIETTILEKRYYSLEDIDFFHVFISLPDLILNESKQLDFRYKLDICYDDNIKLFNIKDSYGNFKYYIVSFDKKLLLDFLKNDFECAIKKENFEIINAKNQIEKSEKLIDKYNKALKDIKNLYKENE